MKVVCTVTLVSGSLQFLGDRCCASPPPLARDTTLHTCRRADGSWYSSAPCMRGRGTEIRRRALDALCGMQGIGIDVLDFRSTSTAGGLSSAWLHLRAQEPRCSRNCSGRGFQVMSSAFRPCIAAHVDLATTTMPPAVNTPIAARRDFEYLKNAWNGQRARRVEVGRASAKRWAARDDGVDHAGQANIETKSRRPGAFVGNVEMRRFRGRSACTARGL